MRKNTKVLASAALMSLVLTTALSTVHVKAAAGQVTRIGEANRYVTAAKVAVTNWTTSDNVVLVSGEGYADALVASALAGKTDSPLVLIDREGTDAENNALAYIKANVSKAANINVIGGTNVIPQTIVDDINKTVSASE